jgi:hypothetical protein
VTALLVAAGVLSAEGTAAAAPVASFTYSPAQPLTGENVTFTSHSIGDAVAWDLDGDGNCGPSGPSVVTRSFPTAGAYRVKICVTQGFDSAEQIQTIIVRNRSPIAAFTHIPDKPVAGERVTLTSTAVDPDGPIVAQWWDLDADGLFDDAVGEIASRVWPKAGTFPVALRVVDREGAVALAYASVTVAKRPARLLSPFPVVAISGDRTAHGTRVRMLAVTAPRGARVAVRCRGRGCPYRHRGRLARHKRVRLRALERWLPAGVVIEVSVTKRERIGKYTRLRIRPGQRPARVDRCLMPGSKRPVRCPAS